jgi:hypothetical protein
MEPVALLECRRRKIEENTLVAQSSLEQASRVHALGFRAVYTLWSFILHLDK